VRRSKGAIMLMILICAIPASVLAQGIAPPSSSRFVTYDPATGEYRLHLESLTPIGTFVADAPDTWYVPSFVQPITVEGSTLSPLKMTYNRYVSPEGYYVLVPSLYTAIVMTFTGTAPFDVQPSGMVVNGWVGIAGYMGWMENIGYTREEVLNGNWKNDPKFWNQLFLSVNDPTSPLYEGTLFVPPAVLIYTCDPTNPADCAKATAVEGGKPGNGARPIHSGNGCPAPNAIQAEIRAGGKLADPPYPVVVGQDPARRGADLVWRVEIPPVIYTWFEAVVVGTQKVCAYDPAGESGGCPAPGSQYDEVTGSATGWHAFMAVGAEASYWKAIDGQPKISCVKHVDMYTDRIQWLKASASLEPQSREWILRHLAARYPGARLYQPDWTWLPPLSGQVLGDGTFVWEWTGLRIAFRDPGAYVQAVAGSTTGTPVTAPRAFNLPVGRFSVWVHEATLSR
jgi:hypothetical protein